MADMKELGMDDGNYWPCRDQDARDQITELNKALGEIVILNKQIAAGASLEIVYSDQCVLFLHRGIVDRQGLYAFDIWSGTTIFQQDDLIEISCSDKTISITNNGDGAVMALAFYC